MSTFEREQISVLALFRDGSLEPKRFQQGRRVYDIKTVNLVHYTHTGRDLKHHFSVSDTDNQTYQIIYEEDSRRWYLEAEQWLE